MDTEKADEGIRQGLRCSWLHTFLVQDIKAMVPSETRCICGLKSYEEAKRGCYIFGRV